MILIHIKQLCGGHPTALRCSFSLFLARKRENGTKRDKRLLAVNVRLDAPICAVPFV